MVDCKHVNLGGSTKKLDVKDVEEFIGMVEDVDADFGVLISTVEFTPAAQNRIGRGIRLRTLPVALLIDETGELVDALHRYTHDTDQPYYASEYFEGQPWRSDGAIIRYYWVHDADKGYSYDPDREPEWMDDVVMSGTDEELHWGDDAGRAICARAILTHYAGGRPPTEADVALFVSEIAHDWQDGQTWSVSVGQIAGAGL